MSVWAAYRELLSNRPLSKLLLGEFVSSIGDGVYMVALVVLVYGQTSDPATLGIIGAAVIVPKFLLSIPAGMVTDRVDRRLVLLASDLGCATCMVILAWLVATDAGIVPIAITTVVAACFSAFFTPAFGALLPSLVRHESEFGPANSAWATLDNLAWVFGPAVAGAVLLFGTLELAFVLNAASYGLIAVVLWTLPRARRQASPVSTTAAPATASAEAKAAAPRFRLRLRVPASIDLSAVAGVVLLSAVGWAAYGGITIMLVILAVDVFRAGEAATGYLNVAIGAGGAAGALLSGVLVLRPRLGPALLLAGAAASAATLLLGIAPFFAVALLAVGVTSAGMMVLDVATLTIYQRVVPDEYRGRFMGLLVTTSSVGEAGGTLVMPMLVGGLGLGLVLGSVGFLFLGATIAATVLIGRAADIAPGEFDAELRRIARLPIFGGLRSAQVEAGLRRLQPIRVEAGDVILRQGETADRFYVVAEGSFDVSVKVPGGPTYSVRRLGRDAVFGERGLLAGRKRAATVTALEPGLLFAMEGPAFLELVTRRAGMRERFLALYDEPPKDPGEAATSS